MVPEYTVHSRQQRLDARMIGDKMSQEKQIDTSTSSGPPAVEPEGYRAAAGLVKSLRENNDYYVAQFEGDPWYPAILDAHEAITRIAPGYNIAQIKEKFGGLRFYYDLGSIDLGAHASPDKIIARIDEIVARAEGWVDGYEYARRP
jgi:hypothetical protein